MENKNEAIDALIRLIEHASETYPHFESSRGQVDIKEACAAVSFIASRMVEIK